MIEIKQPPRSFLKKARKLYDKYHGVIRMVHEEINDGQVWCWVYEYESQTETLGFQFVSIISKTGKSTKSWNGEKWGDLRVEPDRYWSIHVDYDHHYDTDIFGEDVSQIQYNQTCQKRMRRDKKKQEQIDQMMKLERKIPQKVKTWMHKNIPHFILFNTDNRHLGYCTFCAAHVPFEENLVNGYDYKCPKCKQVIRAKTFKKVEECTERVFMYPQKVKGGIMFRFIHLMRYNLPNAPEKSFENIRATTIDGKETWYEKRDFFDSYYRPADPDRWYRNNIKGWTRNWMNPNLPELHRNNEEYAMMAYGYWNDWSELVEGSPISYVSTEVLQINYDVCRHYPYKTPDHPFTWMDEYELMEQMPQIESLIKIGYIELAKQLLHGGYRKEVDPKQKELHKFLKIHKEILKTVSETDRLRDIQGIDKLFSIGFDTDEAGKMWDVFRDINDIQDIIEAAEIHSHSAKKTLRYLKRHKGQQKTWIDYIKMAEKNSVNLADDFSFFPKRIQEAHDSMLEVDQERKNKEEAKKNRQKDQSFEKATKKYRKLFTLETDNFILRPANSVTEIVVEGQCQHNCVGRAGYAEKMKNGKTMILFLRKKDHPDKSYYTVETDMNGRLRQAYAACNQKTDDYEENILPVLQQLERKIRSKNDKHIAG